ncbi:MAG: hypothetical protein PHW52_02075 [Candidatus Pacebacteria bacterium]|nr:hypothetical protein [Candidatus Paceibacterota bacterium]
MDFKNFTPMGGITPENVQEERENSENIMETFNKLSDLVINGMTEEASEIFDNLDQIRKDSMNTMAKNVILRHVFSGRINEATNLQEFFGSYEDFSNDPELIEAAKLAVSKNVNLSDDDVGKLKEVFGIE